MTHNLLVRHRCSRQETSVFTLGDDAPMTHLFVQVVESVEMTHERSKFAHVRALRTRYAYAHAHM
jgi:hypothetical protein